MTTTCPRPDKDAFNTKEACEARYTALLVTDPNFGVYHCQCGKWHGGNHAKNVAARELKSSPMIRLGLNAYSEPEPERPRTYQRRERHAPSPVESRKPHPLSRKRALKAAGGDPRRLETLPDGSVLIHNSPDWRKAG